jgi:hypothetical protein
MAILEMRSLLVKKMDINIKKPKKYFLGFFPGKSANTMNF